MGERTTNYNLYKPTRAEVDWDVEVNDNFDTIDSAIDALDTGMVGGQVTAAKGGTGQDTSAATGFAKISAGTWSVAAITDGIILTMDGAGSAVPTGVRGYLQIPFACTITAARIVCSPSATCVVDIWKDTYANFPPTNADTITANIILRFFLSDMSL